MRQSLEIKLGQRLAMTPQLQQAIRLLQLSTLELQQEIQQALESNMMLELDEGGDDASPGPLEASEPAAAEELKATEEAAEPTELNADYDLDEIGLQDPWSQGDEPVSSASHGDGEGWDFNQTPAEATDELREHLLWQLNLAPFSEADRAIALAIIDSIDDDGYLQTSCEAILEDLQEALDIGLEDIQAVLRRIQRFDPVGVGARDLRETLLIQLAAQATPSDVHQVAAELVAQHLDLLAARDFNALQRKLKITEAGLKEAIELIHTLNPRPGSQISRSKTEYVVPDVYVRKLRGVWRVDLNPDTTPSLRINRMYEGLIRRADSSQGNETLKQHLQEARWFIKSLQSRNETLLKVARSIVERQQSFFELGEVGMQPMVLREIAEAIGMHESTISRVTNQKFMHTPRGILEFKYFFSSGVSTSDGGEASATAIQAMLRKLIAEENPRKPLSDSKLADCLIKAGINVARRTIAKYREGMSIPPSNERKRLV